MDGQIVIARNDSKDGDYDLIDPRRGVADLLSQLIISSALGASAFLMFCFLRTRWSGLYAARKKQTRQASSLPSLPKTFFGWIPVLYRINDNQVLHSAGLDAFVFLAFFKMALRFLAVAAFFSIVVLTPIHWHFTGKWTFIPRHGVTRPPPDDGKETGFLQMMAWGSVEDLMFVDDDKSEYVDDNYLWVYVVSVYLVTGLALYFLHQETERIIQVRQEYLGSQSTLTDRTIRLSGVPKELRNEEALRSHVESLLIGKVESVIICRDWSRLDQLMDERLALLRKLEESWTVYVGHRRVERNLETLPIVQPPPPGPLPSQPSDNERERLLSSDLDSVVPYRRERPTTTLKRGFWTVWRKRVDAIDYFTKQLEKLDDRIKEARKAEYRATPTAFVTMDSVASAQMAVQAVLDPRPLSLIARLAPAPTDIVWVNTYRTKNSRWIRSWTVTIFIVLLSIFWLVPVGSVVPLLNLDSLHKIWPWLADTLKENWIASSLIQSFLPTLVLTLLNVAVPYLYDYLSNIQGDISQSDVELSIISKNYFFTFFNLFFVFTVFGTISDMWILLQESLKDTTKLAYKLAKSLSSFAPFYTNLIVLQGIGIFPFRLLEFGSVATYPIYLLGSKTPRDFAELVAPPVFSYGFFLPQPILILNLCCIYSVLPAGSLILGFGLIYFSIGYIIYKYQLLYAMDHPHHSTGQAWPMICYRIFLGLLVFHISMAAFLSLQKAFLRASLIAPAVIFTIFVWWMFRRKFSPLMYFIALRAMRTVDENDEHLNMRNSLTLDEAREHGLQYVNPNLVSPLEKVWLAERVEGATDSATENEDIWEE